MVGHVTRFGIVSKCESLGNTGQEVSSKYIPLKSFLIVGIFFRPKYMERDCSKL